MVWIDSDHNSDIVRKDIEMWMPIAKKMLCGHDYQMRSVQDVLIEKFANGPSNMPLSYNYFDNYLETEVEKGNDADNIFLDMIPNFRTIPGTAIWVLDIEDKE
jgi:hypothetical protein